MKLMSFKTYLTEGATKKERAFMAYLKAHPFKGNRKFSQSGRAGYHFRFPIDGDDDKIIKFWKDLGIVCVHDPDKDISFAFKEYLLTATDKMPDSDGSLAGHTLWYVNNSRKAASGGESIIGDKELTPDKFSGLPGLTGKLSAIKKVVLPQLKNAYEKNVSNYLTSLVELAGKTSKREAKIDFDIGLSKGDLKRVSKDFGEILGAAWALKTKEIGADKIFFPAAGNEPLVDFYTVGKDGKIGYSVKSGAGAGTSVKNIAEDLESKSKDKGWIKQFSKNEQEIIDLIVHLHRASTTQGVIDANIAMGTPGIKALAKAMGVAKPQKRSIGAITVDQITLWLQSFPTLEKRYEEAKKLYKVFGSETTWRTWKRFGKGNSQASCIINPLGYHVVSYLNNTGQDTLNNAVKALQVLQLDVNVLKDKMSFSVKKFGDINFEFEYHSSISSGTGVSNKIGFKKVK
jgi:hypothetical protein